MSGSGTARLGLRENASQFGLLVAVNAFVGAMVGLERSTLPLIGRDDFGVGSSAAVLSFIVAFGLAKGDPGFKACVDAWVTEAKQSGRMQQRLDYWLAQNVAG